MNKIISKSQRLKINSWIVIFYAFCLIILVYIGVRLVLITKFIVQPNNVVVQHPELIEEGYKGFNLVAYNGKFYGLAQALGVVDLTQLDQSTLDKYQQRGEIVIADSLEGTKKLLSQISLQLSPVLIEEGYKGFNLVAYNGKFYGLAQALGVVDLTQLDQSTLDKYQQRGEIVIADSLEDLKNNL